MGDFIEVPGYLAYEIAINPVRIRRKGYSILKKFHLDQHGYKVVNLGVGKRENRTKERVHRLVALTFVPEITGKPFVNHKDGNKLNNEPDNLEWVTCKENVQHAYRHGLMLRKLTAADVINIQANYSISDVQRIATDFKISKGYARSIVTKNRIIGETGFLETVKLGQGKRVVNLETGEIYRSGAELARHLGIRRKYITRKLNGERNNNTPYRYL